MLASTSCSPTWSKICDYNRGRDKALLRVASDSLFEGVVNSLRDILGVEVNSLSRERLQCPCPVPNEKHECRAGRIGAPSQPEYFTCLSGRVVLKDWFKVPIGPLRRNGRFLPWVPAYICVESLLGVERRATWGFCRKTKLNQWQLAETDESIVRTSARSPRHSRPYPRFSPGTRSATCTCMHFPPRAIEPFV